MESGAEVKKAVLDTKDQIKAEGIVKVINNIGNLKRRAMMTGRRDQPHQYHQFGRKKSQTLQDPVTNPSTGGGYQPSQFLLAEDQQMPLEHAM